MKALPVMYAFSSFGGPRIPSTSRGLMPISIFASGLFDGGGVPTERAGRRQRLVGFPDELLLLAQIPVVQDVSHHHDPGAREGVLEEVARGEPEPVTEAVSRDVLLEDRPHLRKIEADAAEMRVSER